MVSSNIYFIIIISFLIMVWFKVTHDNIKKKFSVENYLQLYIKYSNQIQIICMGLYKFN